MDGVSMADQKLINEVGKYIDKYYEPARDDIKPGGWIKCNNNPVWWRDRYYLWQIPNRDYRSRILMMQTVRHWTAITHGKCILKNKSLEGSK